MCGPLSVKKHVVAEGGLPHHRLAALSGPRFVGACTIHLLLAFFCWGKVGARFCLICTGMFRHMYSVRDGLCLVVFVSRFSLLIFSFSFLFFSCSLFPLQFVCSRSCHARIGQGLCVDAKWTRAIA